MKVLICGSRDFSNYDVIYQAMASLPKDTIIINGAARGADKISTEIANELNLECREYPANWDKYKRSAGPIRNQEMLDKENPDLVYAFHLTSTKMTKGTNDMVTKSQQKNIKVCHFYQCHE